MPSNRGRRFPAHPLTSDEAARLVEACRSPRDRALVAVLYRAGLRAREACSMALSDVRRVPGGMVVRVERPKGFAGGVPPREVGIDPKAAGLLERWLEARGPAPQGFQPDMLDESPFTMAAKRRMVGNGVPLAMGEALARAVQQVISQPQKEKR